ncbi:hypothetical protein FJZ27_04805 [Candidatus Peribacteria bacterium]|nr:hypothetical protein [Candidatus Peribacteria bacterium]
MTVDDIVVIPPVSDHYVKRVLNRANAGITKANGMTSPGGPIFTILKPWWIFYATSAMLSTVDTRVQITGMQRDLHEATACLHLDIIILQSKIEKVREELHLALSANQPFRVMLLQRLIRFLNRRIEHLMKGGRDPLYEDTDWGRVEWFDPTAPVWCCPGGIPGNTCMSLSEDLCTGTGGIAFSSPSACQAYGCLLPPEQDPLDGKLCPFTSDYLPPSRTGFGCDDDALPGEASGHRPTAAELSALADLIAKRETAASSMADFTELLEALDAMASTTTPLAGLEVVSHTHQTIFGCEHQVKKDQRFGTGSFLRDIGSGSMLQALMVRAHETRGPFSLGKQEPWIAVQFTQLMQRWGERRPQAKSLRYPNEFPPGEERDEAVEAEEKKSPLLRARDWFMRGFFRSWNIYHGKKYAESVAKGQDAQLQIAEELRGSQQSLRRLGELISNDGAGLRSFTKGFAYYLRRSCLYRSCNRKLEQILRINFKNECFPYFSGAYFGNTKAHERCKNAANISVSP